MSTKATTYQLSPDQAAASQLLAEPKHNVFLTGNAGTGKSFLIRCFLQGVQRRRFPIVASTGVAAVLVGGRTFHSFFGLGIMEGGVEQTIANALADRRVVNRLKKIDGFVLDEVSMIPGSALQAAESICRQARDDPSPWGGARVIAVGDFAQLPPVSARANRKAEKEWAFLTETWEHTQFTAVSLKTIMRTHDEEFVTVLNKIREGRVDDEVEDYLNRKVDCDAIDTSKTHLFPRRHQAATFSRARLEEIRQPLCEIKTDYVGKPAAVERLKKIAPIPEVLQVKKSAFVMLRVNDPQWRYVNGSVGTLEEIGQEELLIQLRNGRLVEIHKTEFSLLDAEGKVIATATNFPLNLAYATTIHKAQGSTLENLVVDLNGLWEPGQAYVALSRLESGEGLTLTGWDERSIHVDPAVVAFHRALR